MKRYIKELICLILQLVMFYIFPLCTGPTDAIGMVVIILVATWVLAMVVGMFSQNKIKYLYPIAIALLFIPSVFVYYNYTAFAHASWYLADAYVGLLWGMFVKLLSRLINKKQPVKINDNTM